MYANLRVEIEGEADPVFAWRVEIDHDGTTTVGVDGQNGDGNYAEPAGEIVVPPNRRVTIQADF